MIIQFTEAKTTLTQMFFQSDGGVQPQATIFASLRILATTDLHAQIFPFDYYNDRTNDAVGLVRTATLVRRARAETANSILLDNGDFLQGNPLADYIALEGGLEDGQVHPMIAAMNALGYDAATLGNHEFDYGVDFLMHALEGADFPLVSANILVCEDTDVTPDKTLLSPYILIDKSLIDEHGERHTIRLGIIGFAPPLATLQEAKSRNSPVFARDIVHCARSYVPEMKQQGADVIIALSHSGIHTANETATLENATIDLATIDGIDAIIAGHTHQVFPCDRRPPQPEVNAIRGTLHNKPTVMAGSLGAHLGVIDLRLQKEGANWRVRHTHVETRPIFKIPQNGGATALVGNDHEVETAAAKDHKKALDYIQRPIGIIAAPLQSYFAQICPDATVNIVTQSQHEFAQQALAGGKYSHLPLLSAAAPVKAGGRGGPNNYIDIPAGGLAIRHVADLYYYSDFLNVVKITGANLRDWLERACGAFHRILPKSHGQMLLNPDFPSYFFDVILGVTYQIDLSQSSRFHHTGGLLNPNSNRIVNLCYEGKAVTDDMEFAVATNKYRANGGGRFSGTSCNNVIFEARRTNRDIIRDFIANKALVVPSVNRNWSFLPLPETSVLFETGIGARAYVDDIKTISLQDTHKTTQGFAQFRIDL